jgi:hypothetical protein
LPNKGEKKEPGAENATETSDNAAEGFKKAFTKEYWEEFFKDPIGTFWKEFTAGWKDVWNNPGKWFSLDYANKIGLKNIFNFGAGKSSWNVGDILKVWESDKLKSSTVFNFGWWGKWTLTDLLIAYPKLDIKDVFRLPNGHPWKLTDLIDTPKIDLKINFPDPVKAGKDMGDFLKKALDYAWDNVIEKSNALSELAKLMGLNDPDKST